jgi:hypothetical protein
MILDGRFSSFDDQNMISKFREAQQELPASDPLRGKIIAVLNRQPPKLVASYEAISSADEITRASHRNLIRQLREKVDKAAQQFSIPKKLWHIWHASLGLTKIGSRIPVSEVATASFEEEAAQAVRILTTEPDVDNSKSKLLVEHDFALMKQLSQFRFYAIRVFVHIPNNDAAIRNKIESFFKQELPDFPFSP